MQVTNLMTSIFSVIIHSKIMLSSVYKKLELANYKSSFLSGQGVSMSSLRRHVG